MKARLAALATLLLAGCAGYSAPDSVVYGTAVVTQYSNKATWSTYTTYSVDPVVAVVDNTGATTQECSVDGSQLVPTIVAQMDARGYTRVAWTGTNTTDSDLQIKMTAFLGSVDYYYAGYCGWYPYYYCYPGWSYAGSYSFGTLVVDMGDKLNQSGTEIPLAWTAASYGVLASYYSGCSGGSAGNNPNWSRIEASIDRAFEQSPYITKNP